jgi:hypothetical protein
MKNRICILLAFSVLIFSSCDFIGQSKAEKEQAALKREQARLDSIAEALKQKEIQIQQERTAREAKIAYEAQMTPPPSPKWGNCTLVGKLNGRYGVHIVLNDGYSGFMYYDSQGYNTRIQVTGDMSCDQLVIEEYTDGYYTGTYCGSYDGYTYRGTYTRAKDGKNFSFNLRAK